jgi:hypothetical protein
MKNLPLMRALLVACALSLAHEARAQIHIALPNVVLANPSLPAVNVSLNGSSRSGLPTPFLLTDISLPSSAQWFCMDPRQTMLHSGSGEPAGNSLNYVSTNPANFDLWGANAPGLSTARKQNLADLFQAYLPAANSSLNLGAIQLAVWEIANESNSNAFGLGSGFLQVTSFDGPGANGMITLANSLLASLNTAAVVNRGNTASLDFLIDGSYHRNGSNETVLVQDLVGFTPVPEPATYGIAASGLLVGILALRRSRSRKAPGTAIAV